MLTLRAGKGMVKHFQEEYKLVPYFFKRRDLAICNPKL